MFVACQGCSPWFESRVGHLTGTTASKLLKTLKFVLLDDTTFMPSVQRLLEVLGLSLQRKPLERILTIAPTVLKKAYKALGYKAASQSFPYVPKTGYLLVYGPYKIKEEGHRRIFPGG
jgi:hypothetical protein